MDKETLSYINSNPDLLSMLYDVGLMPEQVSPENIPKVIALVVLYRIIVELGDRVDKAESRTKDLEVKLRKAEARAKELERYARAVRKNNVEEVLERVATKLERPSTEIVLGGWNGPFDGEELRSMLRWLAGVEP